MNIAQALQNLCPGASWEVNGNTYAGIVWRKENTTSMPTEQEVTAEVERLRQINKNAEYQRLRAHEYPPATDYLDAVVKGDLAGQQAYIDACLAVKAKYPKPEGL
jgi:hypothetical protein